MLESASASAAVAVVLEPVQGPRGRAQVQALVALVQVRVQVQVVVVRAPKQVLLLDQERARPQVVEAVVEDRVVAEDRAAVEDPRREVDMVKERGMDRVMVEAVGIEVVQFDESRKIYINFAIYNITIHG